MPLLFLPTTLLPLCVMATLITLLTQRSHLLMALLTLEAMILNLMLLLLMSSNLTSVLNLFLAMIMLTFGACEATLGLACLVKMTRKFGNDLISSTNLQAC
uniref:NADH-ubiquinone oxidoreductase chain 4L n=1 Tax=Levensteiniella iris TaxID=2153341 RepID=A0A343W672_9ANNE|nr:NADH dehydrogenase subunit 4L [Levensteiniella iris]